VSHNHSSSEIESQGHRSRSVQRVWAW